MKDAEYEPLDWSIEFERLKEFDAQLKHPPPRPKSSTGYQAQGRWSVQQDYLSWLVKMLAANMGSGTVQTFYDANTDTQLFCYEKLYRVAVSRELLQNCQNIDQVFGYILTRFTAGHPENGARHFT